MKTINVRGMVLGEGREKIISSILDREVDDALQTMELVKTSHIDAIEYRGDWSADVHDHGKMQDNIRKIRASLGDLPILFTFRSVAEGGHMDLPVDEYVALTRSMIDSGCLDMVDVEYWIGDEKCAQLICHAHRAGVKVVYTYHNFKDTPSVEWICNYIRHGRELGGDIPKCATMAQNTKDMLTLLTATELMTCGEDDGPILTMAMGRHGMLSRLTGEIFGSCLTFCSLKAASAPGQVDCETAYEIMQKIHENYSI